jgi:HPr kinase/phosphorylase
MAAGGAMIERPPTFIHANALLIGETGLLLRGVPGSGKSALTLRLVDWAVSRGFFARVIGDDRVAVENRSGRLIARPHPAAAGLIEMRGRGLVSVDFEPAGAIRGVVDLEPPSGESHPRYPSPGADLTQICDVSLPRCAAAIRDAAVLEKMLHFIQSLSLK